MDSDAQQPYLPHQSDLEEQKDNNYSQQQYNNNDNNNNQENYFNPYIDQQKQNDQPINQHQDIYAINNNNGYQNGHQQPPSNIDNLSDRPLNPDDVPLEIEEFDQNKKDMYSYMSMGFDKKYRDLHPKQANITMKGSQLQTDQPAQPQPNQKFGSLDAKAFLIQPPKGLSYYQTKGEINFFEEADLEKGRPIQMIYTDPQTGEWIFNQEASEELMKVKGPISFVSIIGQPASGKSFLMNHLLKIPKQNQFKSGEPHDISTKGIMMWSEPTYNPQTNSHLFFLDSQEFEDEQGGRQIREQLQFFITCLLSQTMMINIIGDLSEDSFLPIQDLANLNDYIDLENIDEKEELGNIFPSIIYILRDHKHIVQQKGSTVAMHTYLDNFIFSDEKYNKGGEIDKKIRRRIVKYFRRRDAFSMIMPVEDQSQLYNLENMVSEELNDNFQDELKALRKKIVYHARKKEFRGVFLSPTMTTSYINSILEDLNNKQKVNLHKAFSILIENEFIYTYNFAIEQYNDYLSQQFADIEFKSFHELYRTLRTARENCFNIFYQLKAHDINLAENFFEEYYERLLKFMQEKEQRIIQFNEEKTKEILAQQVQETMKLTNLQTQNSSFSIDDLTKISDNYQTLINDVLMQAQGGDPQKDPVTVVAKKVNADLTSLFLKEVSEAQNLSQQDKMKLQNAQKHAQDQQSSLHNRIKDGEEKKRQADNEIQILKGKLKDYEQLAEKQKKEIAQHQKNYKAMQAQANKLQNERDHVAEQLERQKKKKCC